MLNEIFYCIFIKQFKFENNFNLQYLLRKNYENSCHLTTNLYQNTTKSQVNDLNFSLLYT